MKTPTFPPEFFSPSELSAMAGTPQYSKVIEWLKAANITFVIGRHGWPLVYRQKLIPTLGEAQNATTEFNFEAARHGPTSRTTAHRH